MTSPVLLIGAVAAIAMHDVVPLILTICLGYIGLVFLGGILAQYELRLDSDEDVEYLANLLDKTPSLQRQEDRLLWTRRTSPLFRSDLDNIIITRNQSGWIAEGRKFNLMSAAAALSQRKCK
jgi:hypothetical protein